MGENKLCSLSEQQTTWFFLGARIYPVLVILWYNPGIAVSGVVFLIPKTFSFSSLRTAVQSLWQIDNEWYFQQTGCVC